MFKEGRIFHYSFFKTICLPGFLIFPSLVWASASLQPMDIPSIRVLIAKQRPQVEISGLDIKRTLHITNQDRSFSGRKSIRFNCQRFGQKNRQHLTLSSPLLLASLTSQTGLLTLDGQRFQGKLKVISGAQFDSCDVIHVTNLEDYIATLLAKEMNASWSLEALKAQAVAARTYAYYKMMSQQVSRSKGYEAFYDLESSESHQVSGNFFDATVRTLQATRETFGQVLKNKAGQLTEVFFHAKCGGQTLVPENVWTHKVQGYKAVKDPYCHDRGGGRGWNYVVSSKRLAKFLNWLNERGYIQSSTHFKSALRLQVIETQEQDAFLKILVNGHAFEFKKSFFRKYFGRTAFQSNNFELSSKDGNLLVQGKGRGHGVGMCQVGALGMAKSGKSYKNILLHYFPGHHIDKIY